MESKISVRGGSWHDLSQSLRVSCRVRYHQFHLPGFRLVEHSNPVARGGSWSNFSVAAVCSYRGYNAPWNRYGDTGFRLKLTGELK